MPKNRIKGITIEIDGSTKGLQESLKDINKKSIELQNELRDVERLLKFDPGNAEAVAQKQELLAKQIQNTEEKLQRLKDAQKEVDSQFANGDIGEDQYRAFRREVEFTERELNNLRNSLKQVDSGNNINGIKKDMDNLQESTDNASDEIKGLGNELLNLAAGAAAVGTIGEVIEQALDVSGIDTKIEVSMDVDEESKQSIKEASGIIQSYGIDSETALEGIRRQWALNSDASDESNAKIVKGAATICAAYGEVDFTELIQESNELAKSLNISDEEALGMVNTLLKMGFPPDQLDIITEYGSQLQRAGYNAEEIQGIMAAGVETGTWNIDILLDGLKEGRIVLAEFGQGLDKETANLFNKIGISATQVEKWGQAVAEGGEGGKLAMQEVAKALASVEDKTLQNQLGTKVFGTLWEENGTNITDTILGMNKNLGNSKSNIDGLNNSIDTLDADPAIAMSQAIAKLKLALEPILLLIANLIGKFAEFMQAHPQLAAAITSIISVVTVLIGIMATLAPVITAVSSAAGVLGISIGAVVAPVLAVIGVITAVITAGVLLYKNWDTIKAKVIELKNSIVTTFNNMKTKVVQIANNIKSSVISTIKGINLITIGRNIVQGLINGIKSKISSVTEVCKNMANAVTSKIKSILGIHSPAKALIELGEYSGEGLVVGLNNKIKAISNKSKELASTLTSNFNPNKVSYAVSSNIDYDRLGIVLVKGFTRAIQDTGMNNTTIAIDKVKLGKAMANTTDKLSGERLQLKERWQL